MSSAPDSAATADPLVIATTAQSPAANTPTRRNTSFTCFLPFRCRLELDVIDGKRPVTILCQSFDPHTFRRSR
nr:hypothetical protein GCM10017745_57070 [Saccharothrix mutabilis subsp. capreolus]